MSRRDEEKKRRRQKRLAKRKPREAPLFPIPLPFGQDPSARTGGERKVFDDAIRALERLEEQLSAGKPGSWPGVADPSLARPDMVKFELATFATASSLGEAKLRLLIERLKKGVLSELPELDHWAIEEFLWHGLPGDSWHPIEAFPDHAGQRFSPEAREQIRRWKEARIGLFQIGEVTDDLIHLQEYDPVRQCHVGEPFRAITLNIGGINAQKTGQGQFLLTHVAPWNPAEGLSCGMGYGVVLPPRRLAMAADFIGLRHLDIAARPLPWRESTSAFREYVRSWRQREWHSWLAERLQFPFQAIVAVPPEGEFEIREARRLLPSTAEQAQNFGIYFDVASPGKKEALAAGGTAILPADICSPNRLLLEEYHAYRKAAGPPPGTHGFPTFARVR